MPQVSLVEHEKHFITSGIGLKFCSNPALYTFKGFEPLRQNQIGLCLWGLRTTKAHTSLRIRAD